MSFTDNSVLTHESMRRAIEQLQARYQHPNTAAVTVNVPSVPSVQVYNNNSFIVGMDMADSEVHEKHEKMAEEPEREPTLREVWAD